MLLEVARHAIRSFVLGLDRAASSTFSLAEMTKLRIVFIRDSTKTAFPGSRCGRSRIQFSKCEAPVFRGKAFHSSVRRWAAQEILSWQFLFPRHPGNHLLAVTRLRCRNTSWTSAPASYPKAHSHSKCEWHSHTSIIATLLTKGRVCANTTSPLLVMFSNSIFFAFSAFICGCSSGWSRQF